MGEYADALAKTGEVPVVGIREHVKAWERETGLWKREHSDKPEMSHAFTGPSWAKRIERYESREQTS